MVDLATSIVTRDRYSNAVSIMRTTRWAVGQLLPVVATGPVATANASTVEVSEWRPVDVLSSQASLFRDLMAQGHGPTYNKVTDSQAKQRR
jgi:hypothetical protein